MTTVDVRSHGATGDGETNDTAAIQRAVDAVAGAGGGTVLLPAGGTYRSGSITLRSHVELHVERGATLAASPHFADYRVRHGGVVQNDGNAQWGTDPATVLIDADGAEDVAITGGGTIDGGGRHYVAEPGEHIHVMDQRRPFTIYLRHCRRVAIRDVRIVDGAVWTLRLSRCDDVVIHAISLHNDLKVPNSDGIDIDCCRRVRISDCDIVAGDDGISLKTCREYADEGIGCEDVTVTGCTITTTSSALVVGAEVQLPMRNIVFSSCVVRQSNRGLAVRLTEHSDIENVLFSDITVETRFFHPGWWGRGEPIQVIAVPCAQSAGHRAQRPVPQHPLPLRERRAGAVGGSWPHRGTGVRRCPGRDRPVVELAGRAPRRPADHGRPVPGRPDGRFPHRARRRRPVARLRGRLDRPPRRRQARALGPRRHRSGQPRLPGRAGPPGDRAVRDLAQLTGLGSAGEG
ncbi:glycosyl hydrolase family 28 protein [Actinomycetes bacterium KLBMP 9759]